MNWTNETIRIVSECIGLSARHTDRMKEIFSIRGDTVHHAADICEYIECEMCNKGRLVWRLVQPRLETVDWRQIAEYWQERCRK